MASTYRKMYLQIVFAVKNRQALLHKPWRSELFKYMAGIVNERGHYSLAVNGYHDHVHLFLDYTGGELVADLVREIKKASNAFVKDKCFTEDRFSWQNGYGVFSHGYQEKSIIMNYIINQEALHENKSFRKEYLQLLNAYEIEFKDKYIFEFFN